MKTTNTQGFTLIELSIVLVIIGLIVGGILVGQDLIKAAEVRATVQQVEKYNSAINTFRSKYNGLPGDLNNAAQFGFNGTRGAADTGDGDGRIDGSLSTPLIANETAWFWHDLGQANMLEGNIAAPTSGVADCSDGNGISDHLPGSKLGRGTNFMVGNASDGKNYYYLASHACSLATGAVTPGNGVTPIEATNIDNKVDDGKPTTGIVVAMDNMNTVDTATAAGGAGCTNSTSSEYQTTTDADATNPICQLRLRFN